MIEYLIGHSYVNSRARIFNVLKLDYQICRCRGKSANQTTLREVL